MILGVIFQLTSNTINKSLRVSKIFFEKGFKVKPRDKNSVFMAALILSLLEADGATGV